MKFPVQVLLALLLLAGCQSLDKKEVSSVSEEEAVSLEPGKDAVVSLEPGDSAVLVNPVEKETVSEDPALPVKDPSRKGPRKADYKDDRLKERSVPASSEPGQTVSVEVMTEPLLPVIEEEEVSPQVANPSALKDIPEPGIVDETTEMGEDLLAVSADETVAPMELESDYPSEIDFIPVNPLLEEESPDIPGPVTAPVEEELLTVVLDKEEVLEPYEPPVQKAEPSSEEKVLLDVSEYVVKQDHLNRLVIALTGSGWIYLSVLSPEKSSLSLLDKKYDPASGKTEFIFRIDGTPALHELVIMKQDLSSGESCQYVLVVGEADMVLPAMAEELEAGESEEMAVEGSLVAESPELPVLDSPEDHSEGGVAAESVSGSVSGENPVPADPDSLTAEELLSLGENYENPGSGQSLEKARDCYLLLLDKFPVSLERFKAEERLRYLDRHYFKVQ